ncbi:MAG: hypothetical protein M1835_002215, partial [Candelina submexicana]
LSESTQSHPQLPAWLMSTNLPTMNLPDSSPDWYLAQGWSDRVAFSTVVFYSQTGRFLGSLKILRSPTDIKATWQNLLEYTHKKTMDREEPLPHK